MRSLQNILFSLYVAVMTIFTAGCSDLPGRIISDPVEEESPGEELPKCSLPASKLVCFHKNDCHYGEQCSFPAPGPECSKESPCKDPGICVCTNPSDPTDGGSEHSTDAATEGIPTSGGTMEMPVETSTTSTTGMSTTSEGGVSSTGGDHEQICAGSCMTCKAVDMMACTSGCQEAFDGTCDDVLEAYIQCLTGGCGPRDCNEEFNVYHQCDRNAPLVAMMMGHNIPQTEN